MATAIIATILFLSFGLYYCSESCGNFTKLISIARDEIYYLWCVLLPSQVMSSDMIRNSIFRFYVQQIV